MPILGRTFAQLYTALAREAYNSGRKLWKISPKLHLFEHLAEVQSVAWGNPRYYWTYSDEDLVGLLVGMAELLHPVTLCSSLLFKLLHIHFPDS